MGGKRISLLYSEAEKPLPEARLSADAERLISDLARGVNGSPTVFVGSGVSIWGPSELPSGKDFTSAMFSALFDESLTISAVERSLLEEVFGKRWTPHFSGMPFEHLMECCPSEAKANTLVNRLYNSRRTNPLHRALAKGLREGRIHSLITTNYDCCLDEALSDEKFPFVKAVTPEQARAALRARAPRYFKIHGSTEGGLETSPMFALRHEGLLDPQKRALLTELIEARPLVMLGYSGLDFELCPEIERIGVADLIWNNLKDYYPSVSAERLIQAKDGTLLFGDMRVLVSRWLGMTAWPVNAPSRESAVVEVVRDIFDQEEIVMWRVRALNSLGLPSFTLKVLETDSTSRSHYFFEIERGRAEFHAGLYKRSRRHFLRALRGALASGRRVSAADAGLEASDAYRSFGAPLRAYACTWSVDFLAARQLTAKKLLKQSLVIRDVVEVVRSLREKARSRLKSIPLSDGPLRIVTTTLTRAFSIRLSKCAKEALRTGNWLDFQQVSLIAEGVGVRLSESGEYYSPPKAVEGYRHLGYYIPQAMIFTSECVNNRGRLFISPEARREWRRHVKLCRRLGINAALWKVLALKQSPKIRTEAREAFYQCEYGKLKGTLVWKKYAG
jgi:hypothetical protein